MGRWGALAAGPAPPRNRRGCSLRGVGVGGGFDAGIRAGPGPESPVRFVLLVFWLHQEVVRLTFSNYATIRLCLAVVRKAYDRLPAQARGLALSWSWGRGSEAGSGGTFCKSRPESKVPESQSKMPSPYSDAP